MELFKRETKINFMGIRLYTSGMSLCLMILAITILLIKGLNFGLEFTGGTQVELKFSNSVQIEAIREQLRSTNISEPKIQHYGSTRDILIRIPSLSTDEKKIAEDVKQSLVAIDANLQVSRIEYVGSEVGAQLVEQGSLAVLLAILSTMVYIALRFEYRFAISAALALVHDSLLVLGIFALWQIEFDLSVLAALLAVLGYSLNDTIVVFDRVRENFRKIRKGTTESILNSSINQTLSRTIMTSWLTLLVVLALLFFGGESLYGFSLALALGIIIGTYSSIYVASGCALQLGLNRTDFLPKARTEIDDLP